MSRMLVTLLLLSAPLLASKNYWVEKLGDPDPAVQKQAHDVLVRQGSRVLPGLKNYLGASPDVKNRIDAVIKEIEKREPFGVQFQAGMPKMRVTVAMVNGKDFDYSVNVRNFSDKAVTLWPYLTLRVLDRQGNPLKPSTRIGRWGRRKSKNLLEDVKFVTIEPGKTWSFKERVSRYMHDPKVITGWKIPEAGNYTLEFTYHYDRAAEKKKCDPKWEALDDPQRPWNQALEFKTTFTTEMKIG